LEAQNYSENGVAIHPTAVVSPEARLGAGVKVGPYSIIGPDVIIGDDTQIGAHAVIEGKTKIGRSNKIYHFVSIGTAPQDLKYAGEPTALEIGDSNVIREFVTIHRGTEGGGGVTRVGNRCLLMAYTHVAHDCVVGDEVVMANGATLGGHVVVGDHVVMGGLSAVHQFCRIGAYAFLGGMSGVSKDVPPFVKFWGPRGRIYGLNLVGLRRHGFGREVISALRESYRILFKRDCPLKEALDEVEKRFSGISQIMELVSFIRSSKRGIPKTGEDLEDI